MFSRVKFHGLTKGGRSLLINLLAILLYCVLILHNKLSNMSKKFILNYSFLLHIRKDGMYLYVFSVLSLSVHWLYLNRAPFSKK